jgi:DNA polymerase I-like protein with 3'-5' exonuclease and polymerase domains
MLHVEYVFGATSWKCAKLLKSLEKHPLMSFDTETAGVYSKVERKEAQKLLDLPNLKPKQRSEYSIVATNSGLSYPSLVRTTHFVFGITEEYSVILVTPTRSEEMLVWNWVKNYQGHLVIHNALFDLKIMYHRVKAFPKHYTDTALMAKCLINNANNYEALIGLKELMGSYYKPEWSLFDSYEPEDLLEPKFMDYTAIDGAATIHLWEDLQEHTGEKENE